MMTLCFWVGNVVSDQMGGRIKLKAGSPNRIDLEFLVNTGIYIIQVLIQMQV